MHGFFIEPSLLTHPHKIFMGSPQSGPPRVRILGNPLVSVGFGGKYGFLFRRPQNSRAPDSATPRGSLGCGVLTYFVACGEPGRRLGGGVYPNHT